MPVLPLLKLNLRIFIGKNKEGKFRRLIFEDHGFNIDINGMKHIKTTGK